ncbi:MAG TPA: ABC transporter permease [Vicinamibacteria bacterium]
MRLRRAARLSIRTLLAHKVRTTLALTSVAMGVAGVLLTSAIGKGAEVEVQRGIEAAGANLLVVRPAQVKRSAARKEIRGIVSTLRLDDYHEIEALPLPLEAAPGVDGGLRVKAGSGSMAAGVLGTAPALARLRNLRLASGRFFDAEDDAAAQRVAVLGARVARTLFPDDDAVGKDIRVRGLPFEVIGVLEPKGIQADGSDQDGNVFVPIRTALRRVFNTTSLSAVFVSVAGRERMPEVDAALRDLLRERHRLRKGAPDDFQVQDQARLLAMQQQVVEALTLLTAGLAAVSLLVGGAGIFALMFLSVKERTSEIGLRMAVGARPRDVLVQFLGEATLLAVGGWLLGSAAAALGGLGVAVGTEWKVAFPTTALGASFLMSLVTGLGFGAFPARKAALLPPIQALGSAT